MVEWLPAPDMLVPQFGREFHEARFRNQKWKFTLKSHGELVMQAPLPSTTTDRGNYIGRQIFKGTWMKNGNTVKFSFKTYTKHRDKEFIEHADLVGVIEGSRIVLDFFEAAFPANSPREQVPRRYNLWLKLNLVQQFPKQ